MSDDVRHPREFEPPPWEQAQFEELRRRREAEQAEQERLDAVAAQTAATEASVAKAGELPGAESLRSERSERAAARAEAAAGPDPAEVDLLMMGLAAQEPDVAQPFRRAGLVIAAIVAIVGAVTVIAGIVGLVMQGGKGGVMGTLAASVVIAFGLLLIAGGGWLTILALKQRGA